MALDDADWWVSGLWGGREGRRCESSFDIPGWEAVSFSKQCSDLLGYLCQVPRIYSTRFWTPKYS